VALGAALEVQQQIIDKKLKFYVIDAFAVAKQAGLGRYISTVMQTCFFALSGVLPKEEAMTAHSHGVEKAYGKRGEEVVKRNFAAVDGALAKLHEVKVPAKAAAEIPRPPAVPKQAPEFVQRVTATMIAGKGDLLPVSAFPIDGTWPTGTTQWEKRAIALEMPKWDQSSASSATSARSSARTRRFAASWSTQTGLAAAPASFVTTDFKSKDFGAAPAASRGSTRCRSRPTTAPAAGCAWQVCPAQATSRTRGTRPSTCAAVEPCARRARQLGFFEKLPYLDRAKVKDDVKASQFLEPLFEFSGACSGCGETPYLKLLSQLFGDRMMIANATGCSSIYGGNLPTTPWTKNATVAGRRGPTRCSKTTPSSAWVCGWRSMRSSRLAQALLTSLGAERGRRAGKALLGERRKTRRHRGAAEHGPSAAAEAGAARHQARGEEAGGSWPTRWCASRCGSSAATAGPTTSASAASTTCSPRAPT
jgi:pyruvate-ferredoxin/flavodoxin oxidoreductase